jgi:hypothetical protein
MSGVISINVHNVLQSNFKLNKLYCENNVFNLVCKKLWYSHSEKELLEMVATLFEGLSAKDDLLIKYIQRFGVIKE